MPRQGGVGWAEIGHLYDATNDPVTTYVSVSDAANHRIRPHACTESHLQAAAPGAIMSSQ
jgi:hypothetical protein